MEGHICLLCLFQWGIDSNARNDEGYSALDVVNLFTSSKASSEIKQLLKGLILYLCGQTVFIFFFKTNNQPRNKTLFTTCLRYNTKRLRQQNVLSLFNLHDPYKKKGVFFSLIISIVSDAAAADRTLYARAVRDHFNMLDPTALPFKTGDTIIVRPNGCLL